MESCQYEFTFIILSQFLRSSHKNKIMEDNNNNFNIISQYDHDGSDGSPDINRSSMAYANGRTASFGRFSGLITQEEQDDVMEEEVFEVIDVDAVESGVENIGVTLNVPKAKQPPSPPKKYIQKNLHNQLVPESASRRVKVATYTREDGTPVKEHTRIYGPAKAPKKKKGSNKNEEFVAEDDCEESRKLARALHVEELFAYRETWVKKYN